MAPFPSKGPELDKTKIRSIFRFGELCIMFNDPHKKLVSHTVCHWGIILTCKTEPTSPDSFLAGLHLFSQDIPRSQDVGISQWDLSSQMRSHSGEGSSSCPFGGEWVSVHISLHSAQVIMHHASLIPILNVWFMTVKSVVWASW